MCQNLISHFSHGRWVASVSCHRHLDPAFVSCAMFSSSPACLPVFRRQGMHWKPKGNTRLCCWSWCQDKCWRTLSYNKRKGTCSTDSSPIAICLSQKWTRTGKPPMKTFRFCRQIKQRRFQTNFGNLRAHVKKPSNSRTR